MSKIDSRIVELKFNTSDFEAGVKRTKDNMKQLDSALNLDGVAKGVENISSKFSPMGAIAFTALQRLTNSAIDFGLKIGNAITTPLVEGGRKRAMSIEQAKFQFEGLGMDVEQAMDDALYAVKGTAFGLDEAAMAASMFGASGVESGEEMKQALRGISGVAAMSGSSYTDMANVFTKVAGQGRLMGDDLNRLGTRGINAAATLADYFNKTGEVVGATEADIREMVTRGEIDFNTFAMAMSDAFGEHATKASETFTGALANMNAALARIGEMAWAPHLERMRKLYNSLTPIIDGVAHAVQPLIKGFSDLVDISFDNLTNFLDNLGFSDLTDDFTPPIIEGLMSIFDTILSVVEPIHQAWLDVFPPMAVENVRKIGDAVKSFADSIKPTSATLENIGSTFRGLFAIVGIGWEIFKALLSGITSFIGAVTGGSGAILAFTGSIGDWIFKLYEAIKAGDGLSNFFSTLGTIVAAPIRFVLELASAIFGMSSGIGDFLGSAGSFIASLFGIGDEAGKTMTIAERFAGVMENLGGVGELLGDIWRGVVDTFKNIGGFLSPLFTTISSAASDLFEPLKEAFTSDGIQGLLDVVNTGIFAIIGKSIYDFFKSLTDSTEDSGGLVSAIQEIFGGVTDSLEALQNTLKAKTLLAIAGAIALLSASIFLLSTIDGASLTTSLTGLAVMFAQMMGALSIFQKIISAGGLIQLPIVATGLILLAGAMLVLSTAVKNLADLNWGELLRGLTGVMGMLGAVAGFMHLMPKNPTGMISTGIGMIAVAGALIVLAEAVSRFSDMSWGELSRGMAGVAGGLLILAGAMRLMPTKGMILMGTGLVIVASAVNILAGALEKFSSLSWSEIGAGLAGMAGSLVILAVAMKMMPKNLILTGVGLAIVAASIGLLADGVVTFSSIPLEKVGAGLLGLAGSLIVIAGAMRLMPANMIITAAGLVVVGEALKSISGVMESLGGMSWEGIAKSLVALAGALVILAGSMMLMSGTIVGSASLVIAAGALTALAPALISLSGMSWEEIGKGLTMLAGALLILAGGMYLMTGALPGAAALVVIAGALTILTPVLIALGNMSWGEIGIGLAALGGSLAVIGIAGALLTPVIPTLLGLGAAIALIGGGAALAGVGLLSMSSGLAAIVGLGAGGIAVLVSALTSIIELIPKMLTAIAEGLIGAVVVLAEGASDIVGAVTTIILEFISSLREIIPEIVSFGVEVIMALLEGIAEVAPELIQTGADILTELLKGIEQVFPQLVETAKTVISTILDAAVEMTPDIVTAGIDILVALIEGLTERMQDLTTAGVDMIVAFIEGISEGASDITEAALGLVVSLIEGIESGVENIVTAVGELITTFINTIEEQASNIVEAGVDLIVALIEGIGEGAVEIVSAVGDVVVSFIEAFDDYADDLITAGKDLIITLIKGIGGAATEITTVATEVIVEFITAMGKNTNDLIEAGTQLVVDVLAGLEKAIPQIATATLSLITTFTTELGKFSTELGAAGLQLLVDVIDGITDNIDTYAPILRESVKALGVALIDGIAPGMRQRLGDLWSKLTSIVDQIFNFFKSLLGIQSPSTITKTMGGDLMQGLINGITGKIGDILTAIGTVGGLLIDGLKSLLGIDGSGSSKTHPFGSGLIRGLIGGVGGMLGGLNSTVAGAGVGAIGTLSNRLGISGASSTTTAGFGGGLMSGLGSGVNKGRGSVLGTIGSVATGSIGRFSSGLGIRGRNSSETQAHGSALMRGLDSGVNNGKSSVLRSVSGVTSNTLKGFSSRLTVRSTISYGSNLMNGLRSGISNGWSRLSGTISNITTNIISRFRSRMSSRTLYSSGINLVSGLTAGIRNSWGSLAGAISNIASNAIARFKASFQIKSPSRVLMGIGEFVGEGLAVGIEDSGASIVKASDGVASQAVESMRKALSGINDSLDSNMDNSPVIRPILDLSDLENGYGRMSSMLPSGVLEATLSQSQARTLSTLTRDINGTNYGEEASGRNSTVQYIQNINSPKSLSEKEIYRKTKGLINTTFGEIE